MHKTENIVKYREIGEVRYVINKRARNLAIRINQQGEVRVTIPRYVNQKRAEGFLMSKKKWIVKKLVEMRKTSAESRIPEEGGTMTVREKEIRVVLKNGDRNLEDAIWRILNSEASSHLPHRVKELASEHGLSYSGVKIRRMKTRWGSCTVKNSINLNSWLMMLPDHLADYVILHELMHTRHKDHSPRFWQALDEITRGRSKMLRKEIRKQRIMYFPEPGRL